LNLNRLPHIRPLDNIRTTSNIRNERIPLFTRTNNIFSVNDNLNLNTSTSGISSSGSSTTNNITNIINNTIENIIRNLSSNDLSNNRIEYLIETYPYDLSSSNIYNRRNGRNGRNGRSNFFDPVPVVPTEIQIDDATEIIEYNSNTIQQTTDPIDQIDFSDNELIIRIKQCGHCFRSVNIRSWFRNSVRCPLCRIDIRDYNQNNSENDTYIDNNIPITPRHIFRPPSHMNSERYTNIRRQLFQSNDNNEDNNNDDLNEDNIDDYISDDLNEDNINNQNQNVINDLLNYNYNYDSDDLPEEL